MNDFKGRLRKRVALSLCALDDDTIANYMRDSVELSCLIVPLLPVSVLSRLVFKLEPHYIDMLPIDSITDSDFVRLATYFLERVNEDCLSTGQTPKCHVNVLGKKNSSISIRLIDFAAKCFGQVSIKN
jgi:hypothetical protein